MQFLGSAILGVARPSGTQLASECTYRFIAREYIHFATGKHAVRQLNYQMCGTAKASEPQPLAFYSFVGFEDLVNMAEEVKDPPRTLPTAILISIGLMAVLYGAVTVVGVLAVPIERLAESKSPLSLIVGEGTLKASVMACIGMLAGVNGALVQIVMASRVAYGMGKKGLAPRVFANVHRVRQTPVEATVVGTLCVMLLALWFPLVWLAKATITILLIIYALVNLPLLVINRTDPDLDGPGPRYAMWLPLLGLVACLTFLAFHAISAWR